MNILHIKGGHKRIYHSKIMIKYLDFCDLLFINLEERIFLKKLELGNV